MCKGKGGQESGGKLGQQSQQSLWECLGVVGELMECEERAEEEAENFGGSWRGRDLQRSLRDSGGGGLRW